MDVIVRQTRVGTHGDALTVVGVRVADTGQQALLQGFVGQVAHHLVAG